ENPELKRQADSAYPSAKRRTPRIGSHTQSAKKSETGLDVAGHRGEHSWCRATRTYAAQKSELMPMAKHPRWALVMGMVLLNASPGTASEMDRLAAILKVIKERHDTYDPVYLKYSAHTIRSKLFYAYHSQIGPEDKRALERYHDSDTS